MGWEPVKVEHQTTMMVQWSVTEPTGQKVRGSGKTGTWSGVGYMSSNLLYGYRIERKKKKRIRTTKRGIQVIVKPSRGNTLIFGKGKVRE